MELYLPPEIPYTHRREDGKIRFTKGHKALKKGLTYDEFYGKERSKEIRKKIAEAHTGKTHPNYYHGKPVVAIHQGKLMAVFPNSKVAAQAIGVDEKTLRRYVYKLRTPRNGWQWFHESNPEWIDLITY